MSLRGCAWFIGLNVIEDSVKKGILAIYFSDPTDAPWAVPRNINLKWYFEIPYLCRNYILLCAFCPIYQKLTIGFPTFSFSIIFSYALLAQTINKRTHAILRTSATGTCQNDVLTQNFLPRPIWAKIVFCTYIWCFYFPICSRLQGHSTPYIWISNLWLAKKTQTISPFWLHRHF